MNETKKLILVDENGKQVEYSILLAFKWFKNNKHYVVYTDNSFNNKGELNVFASIYYPFDDTRLDPVETDEEWDVIKEKLQDISKRGVYND